MEFPYIRGQRLVIELTNNQIFEGDCEKCTKDRIDMVNVIEYPKCQKLKDLLSYYRCEIGSVRVVEREVDKKEEGTSFEQPVVEKQARPQSSPNVIDLSREEYERLKDMTLNYVYMATMDRRYLDAVDHLSNCENIGVVGIGSQFGRKSAISLLVLASWNQVYIFDLLLYSKKVFPPDLKIILESDEIQKVVHDSRALVDCLWHRYKVKLNNIFDTHVADIALEKKQTGSILQKTRNLSECLAHRLNFPKTFLEQAMEVDMKEWEERPLSDSKKIEAAQFATYLITLKNKLERMLLKGYCDAVRLYSQMLVNLDSYNVGKNLDTTSIPEEIKELL